MVTEQHLNQRVTYRGLAFNMPAGITSFQLKLHAVGGDMAWLESDDQATLFMVQAKDCYPTYTAPFVVDPEFDSWKLAP